MKTTKTLKDYNKIFAERETASISDIAEAAAFFANMGGQFSDRGKILKKKLDAYKGTDLFKEAGVENIDFEFKDGTYALKDSTVTTTNINSKEIMKLKEFLPADYFETTIVINKDKLVADYMDGKLPDIIKPYVEVWTQTSLCIKKKPTRK